MTTKLDRLITQAWNYWTTSDKAAISRKSCSGEFESFRAGARAMAAIAKGRPRKDAQRKPRNKKGKR